MSNFFALKTYNHILNVSPYLHAIQRRWAQVHDIRFRFLATQSDKILERYHTKLERKAQE